MTHSLETPIPGIPLAILDVETTGLSPGRGDRVCEVAVLRVRNAEETGAWETLIDPVRPISPGASAVNGITDAMVRGAPRFEAVADRLLAEIGDAVLVAHNSAFDLGFLRAEFRRAGRELPDLPVLDTLLLARRRFTFPSNSLPRIAAAFELPTPFAHRAMGDVRTTCQVLHRLLRMEPLADVTTLGGLMEAQGGARTTRPAEEGAGTILPATVEEAMRKHRALRIAYVDAAGRRTERVIEPVRLKEGAGDAVYLVALSGEKKEERNFPIDRIVGLDPA